MPAAAHPQSIAYTPYTYGAQTTLHHEFSCKAAADEIARTHAFTLWLTTALYCSQRRRSSALSWNELTS